MSSECEISAGVPQVSIIGPLLFIPYTSDILKSVKLCSIKAYADDTQLYFSFNPCDINYANEVINSDLQIIYNISKEHNLLLNSLKTNILIVSSRKDIEFVKAHIDLKINGSSLQVSQNSGNLA